MASAYKGFPCIIKHAVVSGAITSNPLPLDKMTKYPHLHPTTIGKPYPKAWIIGKTLEQITTPAKSGPNKANTK
jgi:hypothetical protein